jgi:3-oxoacyl-[acyl-carrier protein] reductase
MPAMAATTDHRLRRRCAHMAGAPAAAAAAAAAATAAVENMNISFVGKLCLVTGCGHGLGRRIGLLLSELGGTVWGCDIRFDDFGAPDDGAGEAGMADERTVDVTDETAVASWVAAAEAAFGAPVYVLVNSAGGTGGNPTNTEPGFERIEELTSAKFTRLFEINVLGVVNTSKAVVPGMKRAGVGKIVNIASGAGLQPSLTGIQGYTTAKHAEIGLTKQLALELGPSGITVNAIAPGFFRSNPSSEKQFQSYTQEKQQSVVEGTFMQRPGRAIDIAHGVAFLCSEYSTFISGQVLSINGGGR